MRKYKFKKLSGSDKVFVKLTGLNYISYLRPVAFTKDFFIDSWIKNSKLCLKIILSFVQAEACKK